MSTTDEGTLVVADRRRALLQRSLAVGFLILALVGAASAAPERGPQILLLGGGAAASFAAVRVANARVVADGSGLVLKGPVRSTHIEWSEVERFAINEPRHRGDPPQPVVELHDGTALVLPGLTPPFALVRNAGPEAQLEAVADLNSRLRDWRSAQGD